MSEKKKNRNFAVLGLGRFGTSVVKTLAESNVDILACDCESSKLHEVAEYATHVVQADVTDENALINLGLGNFDVVILGMGEDFEASQIAAMTAKEQGASWVIVKARNKRQKKILESIGVDEVILPEHEMGIKIARKLVGFNVVDVLEESEYYTISEMKPMKEWIGKTIKQADIRRKHSLTVLAIRREGKLRMQISPDQIIEAGDVLITVSEHEK